MGRAKTKQKTDIPHGGAKQNEDVNRDYRFLRDNGLSGKVALRILAVAYKEAK